MLQVTRYGQGGIDIRTKKPMPFVNLYYFHIIDPEWGHLIIRFCPHPPFNAQVILNGHEYVERRAAKRALDFTKEGNCFTQFTDPVGLSSVAETMIRGDAGVGRLVQASERWIYSSCLCFALELEEQRRCGFAYRYRQSPRIELSVERPAYDLTVFKIHFGLLTVKMYSKGERVLRLEVIIHNARRLGCGCGIDRFPTIVGTLKDIVERFVERLCCVAVPFIDASDLEKWPKRAKLAGRSVAGIDINQPRMQAVLEATGALAISPRGFKASELAQRVRQPRTRPPPRSVCARSSLSAFQSQRQRSRGGRV